MSIYADILRVLTPFLLTDKTRVAIDAQLPFDVVMNESEFKAYLPLITLGTRQGIHLTEACAIAYYQQQTDFPIIERLLADDAPQFKLLTLFLCLCWIHDARHYKKLKPFVPGHQQALADFRSLYWAYYTALLKYNSTLDIQPPSLRHPNDGTTGSETNEIHAVCC